MKLQKRILLATAFALMTTPISTTANNVLAEEWQPRTIEQVKAALKINEDNQTVYTIEYGDTLGVIAEALEIDVEVLGSINAIADLDLIYPSTVLTTTYDDNQKAETVLIETADSETEAEINLAENELVVNDETYELPATEDVSESASAPVYVTEPVEEWLPETTEAESTEVETTEAPVTETTAVEPSAAPVETTTEATTIEEWVTETTEAETTAEMVEETEAPIVEETAAEVVEETEAPVVEETTAEVVEETEAPIVEETTAEMVEETTIEWVPEETEAPIIEETTVEWVPEETEAPIYDPTNDGLQAHVAQFKNEVANAYGITSFSTYRPGDAGDHGQGLAVDFMVPVGSALGDEIAQYAINQIGSSKISYVIWKQQIYGDWNMSWQMMEDRGSITANHMDHVHVSFYP
ncbi:LysM peptidoglycan-binding domain-containing protein [Globicatella sanguinis]|uniref:LysM peptidoglycan-binding domain-containing protein n=1 Tax=Globicatella sanguinis TaxID=13076 RepID=UPI000826CD0B|nr:LysM domain-containing protein [Globicatella sanguinis]